MRHQFDPQLVHHDWDPARPAALRVSSGDIVDYHLRMAGHGQLTEDSPASGVDLDFDTLYHLAGPIEVEGAQPGQTLRVDILELAAGPWGWCMILPELGLLPDKFSEPYLKTFDLRGRDRVDVGGGILAPVTPFLGVFGTQPDSGAALPAFPPHAGGGNVDTRHLRAGTTLWLPIHRPGAIFSCGDPHAMQGDGEVCVCALECDMAASLRLTVEDRHIPAPMFRTTGGFTPLVDEAGHTATMGLHADLYEGARLAVWAMVEQLAGALDLPTRDAYIAASLIGDLKIFEVVDAGVWNVGFTVPNAVLPRPLP